MSNKGLACPNCGYPRVAGSATCPECGLEFASVGFARASTRNLRIAIGVQAILAFLASNTVMVTGGHGGAPMVLVVLLSVLATIRGSVGGIVPLGLTCLAAWVGCLLCLVVPRAAFSVIVLVVSELLLVAVAFISLCVSQHPQELVWLTLPSVAVLLGTLGWLSYRVMTSRRFA